MGLLVDGNIKDKEILDELFVLSKHNIIVKNVLDYYRHGLKYPYPQMITNLNEILITITKSLVSQNKDLNDSLKAVMQQSDRPIYFQ